MEIVAGWIVVTAEKNRNRVSFHTDRDCAVRALEKVRTESPTRKSYLSAEKVTFGRAQRIGLAGRCRHCVAAPERRQGAPAVRDAPFPGLNRGQPGTGKRR